MPPSKRLGDRQLLKAFAARAPDGPSFAILAGLLAFADTEFVAWPSNRTLAATIGVSLSTLERRIPKLERLGFFHRRKIHSGGRLMKTEYHFSGFIQQSLALDTVTQKASSDSIPSERRDHTLTETASIPSERRSDTVTVTGKGTSEGTSEGTNEGQCVPGLDLDAWAIWVEYRRQINKKLKPASIGAAQRRLAAFGDDQAAVVEQSIANGWQGLFDLRSNRNGGVTYAQKARDETTDQFMANTEATQ